MKTKFLILTFIISSFSLLTVAQQELYYEGFSSKGTWTQDKNAIRSLETKNGKYYFEHFKDGKNRNVTTRDIQINTSKNFEMQTSFQKISGGKSHATGLLYGAKNGDNTYQFVLSNKQYRISEKRNGKFIQIKKWTTSSSIKTGYFDYNTLKIVKKGSSMYYYINGTLVATLPFKEFIGNRLGFVVYNEQKIAIDYFRVKQLSGTSNITKSTTTSQSKTILFEGFNSNKNEWAERDSDDVRLDVKDGDYIINHKRSSGGWSSTIDKKFDTSRDYRISANIKKISGIQTNGFGLITGRSDSDNQNQFFISARGSFIVSKHVNGKRTYLKNWTKSSHIKTGNGASNILTIKKKGSKVEYLINSKVVYTNYSYTSYGNRTGFIVYDNQKVSVSYLSMSYLDNKSTITTNTTTTNNKSVIFEDNFSSNKNNWSTTNTNEVDLEVRNNRYYFEHKRADKGWSSTKVIDIDTNKDFEIEARILKISGIRNNGFGFTFGRKNSNNQYIFSINSNGSYSIDQYKDGKYTAIKDWTKSSHIKTGNYAYNTLKIKKERGFTKFYVNDRYLTLHTHKPFMGKRIGFIVYNNQKIAITDFKVKYINQKNTVTKPTIVAKGENILTEYFTDNSNNWPTGNNTEKNTSVSNSLYNFEHKLNKSGWAVNIPKTIDTSRDFEIKTNIKKVSGVSNYSYGLQWGKEGNNSFRFYLTGNGYYKIARVVNNKEEIIKKFTTSSAIKKGNGVTNTLRVVKKGDHYNYYVNGTYLTQTNFESFYGHRLGFVVFNKQKIGVDNIYIKYLKKANNTIVTSNTLKVPLKESFSGNTNGWNLTDNSNVKTRISNGKLYVKSKADKGGAFISKKVGIDTSRDFIIETSITRLTSDTKGSISFVFGRKNNTNEFDLFLSKGGSYLLRKLVNDKSNKLIPWTSSSALNTQTYQANKIKIVKSNKLLRLYINDQYVNEAPYSEFFGNYIGFSVYNKQEISIDYLNVSYPSASFNTPPEVVIVEPVVQRGFKIVKTKKIVVRGKATDKDGIYEVMINGVDATISDDGSFTANVPLKIGTNDLIVKATDLKQASSTKKFTIKRKSPDVIDDDPVIVKKDKKINTGFGKYYALLIGVSDYGDGAITDLGGLPTKDAKDLSNVLINKYNFERENVVILNNSPKANDIIKEFSKLKKKVTSKDNLLVFYAGHGVYDEVSQVGHWLPSDADMEYELNLISNSQVVDFLKSIQSKHTLLISDACFSGSIFKTRSFEKSPKSVQKKYELTSRKAITSGTLKTVPNKSMFLKYLLKRLENNTNMYLSARQLFDRIEEPVMNNSPNTPQYGTIYGIGDEGGDFIFIKN